jgi:hypothetical protein
VLGVSNSIYEGFKYRRDAERAYILAYTLGAVRLIPSANSSNLSTSQARPTPEAFVNALEDVADDFLGENWHVVFKGKRPGVYPSW